MVDAVLLGVLDDTGSISGSYWFPRSRDKAKNELLELNEALGLLNAELLEKLGLPQYGHIQVHDDFARWKYVESSMKQHDV